MGFPLISGTWNAFPWNLVNHVIIKFHYTFNSTNLYNSYFTSPLPPMLFKTLDWLLSLPVDHSRQPVAWSETGKALDWCELYFSGKYWSWELILINVSFLIKKIINSNKTSKYKTMYTLLINVHLDFKGSSIRMLAEINLSKLGMNLSKPAMNLSKPGKNRTIML